MFSLQLCTLMSLPSSKTSRPPLVPWIASIPASFFKDPKLQRSLRSVALVFVHTQPQVLQKPCQTAQTWFSQPCGL